MEKINLNPKQADISGGEIVIVEGGLPPQVQTSLLQQLSSVGVGTWINADSLSVFVGPTKVPCVISRGSNDQIKLSFRAPPGPCLGKVIVKICHTDTPSWEGRANFRYKNTLGPQISRPLALDGANESETSLLIDRIDDTENPAFDFQARSKGWHEETLASLGSMEFKHVHEDEPVTLRQCCMAEFTGTFLLVLFGVGAVSSAVLSGAQLGLWQVAVVWGFGLSIAILTTASISGAHLNPAVTFAFAVLRPRDVSPRRMLCYWIAQFAGAFFAGMMNLFIFNSSIRAMESRLSIVRGSSESVLTAMVFGEYFPNPGFAYEPSKGQPLAPGALGWSSPWAVNALGSFAIEAWGTAVLVFVIFSLTDSRNKALGNNGLAPFFIGFTVAVLISLYAPLNQAGFNPARDFGPRLVAVLGGWGNIAIPGPRWGFWTYLVGPMVGAPLGGAFHDFVLAKGLRRAKKRCC